MTAGLGLRKSRATAPTFVELPAPLARSVTDPGTLELTRPSGARLVLRLPAARPRHLLPVTTLRNLALGLYELAEQRGQTKAPSATSHCRQMTFTKALAWLR